MTDLSEFDRTGLNLLLSGDRAGFTEYLDASHPTNFTEVQGALGEFVLNALRAESSSSVTIGTGSKSFTLDVAKSWSEGTPVFIYDTADPANSYMHGQLSADESGGVITVDVVLAEGSGTVSSWKILVLAFYTTVSVPPVLVADGGTGETSLSNVRTAWELIRKVEVASVLATPPGSPSDGDAYLVGYEGDTAPSGDFAGHENEIATRTGGAWVFEDLNDGDLVLTFFSQELLVKGNHNADGRGFIQKQWRTEACEWYSTTPARAGNRTLNVTASKTFNDNNDAWYEEIFILSGTGTLGFPAPLYSTAWQGKKLYVFNRSGNTWTIEGDDTLAPTLIVSGGGGGASGVASFTLANGGWVELQFLSGFGGDNIILANRVEP